MADWIAWLTFAIKVLEILGEMFGHDSKLVSKLGDKLADQVVAKLGNQPDIPRAEIEDAIAEVEKAA